MRSFAEFLIWIINAFDQSNSSELHLLMLKYIYSVFIAWYLFSCKTEPIPFHQEANEIIIPDFTVKLIHNLPFQLSESSGLCYTDGILWSFNDAGNSNTLYRIDTTNGAILQTLTIENQLNTDWEDITADSLYIYIGDFGNNDGNRNDLKILKIKKNDIDLSLSNQKVTAETIHFSYADQLSLEKNTNSNYDCEAMVSVGDFLYIFTKNHSDLQTRCYRISKVPGEYSVSPIRAFNTSGKVTAAAYNTTTKELALLGYMNQKIRPFIWFFSFIEGDDFFGGKAIRKNLDSTSRVWQTEGLDFKDTNNLFLSNEAAEVPAGLFKITYPTKKQ
jgi:hypothetical protein